MVRSFANLSLDHLLIMGIVNVTPDSFTDGGEFLDVASAIDHGKKLLADGADILDIGGESTRPGAVPVSSKVEAGRVLPVIEGLAKTGAVISIDTRHADVMTRALDAGAVILNDVSALEGEGSLAVAAKSDAAVVLMHMQGEPATMMDNPTYKNVVGEVSRYLGTRIDACVDAGIDKARIAIDPGFGFGKTRDQNLKLIDNLDQFKELGCPILVGLSRKFGRHKKLHERLPESFAVAVKSVHNGAEIFRVHDVAETRDALSALHVEGA